MENLFQLMWNSIEFAENVSMKLLTEEKERKGVKLKKKRIYTNIYNYTKIYN